MSYPRWFRLLLMALVLQPYTVGSVWAQAELSFTRQDTPLGAGARDAATGDFDSDGEVDLVITTDVTPTTPPLRVLLGNGDGTFRAAPTPPNQQASGSTIVADLNDDGRQDLVTANFVGTLSIRLGNGDGTFQAAPDINADGAPGSIAAGDFNGDDAQDLAVTTFSNGARSLSIYLGTGDGTFSRGQEIVDGSPFAVTASDFNGDGLPDLAAIDFIVEHNRVLILLGQGDGTFVAVAQASDVGPEASSLTVGDFNGDGRRDVATADGNNDVVSVLIGNGDGTFAAARHFPPGFSPGQGGLVQPLSIEVGDFDGDGRQDLATANRRPSDPPQDGSASVLLGRGDGTFEPAREFATTDGTHVLVVADFNSDGRPDLATFADSDLPADAMTVLTNTTAVVITTYRLTRIGDEAFSPIVSDINEKGEMVGFTRGFGSRALLLRNGAVTELGDLVGGASPNASAAAINDLTQITGTNEIQDSSGNLVERGFLWEDGQVSDLGVDPGAIPLDINNRGEIVGATASGEPFLWQAGQTKILETLFCPGNLGGRARAINNHGVIVGFSTSRVGGRAVIWKDGGRGIMSLEPPFLLQVGEAVDVNDRGEVIGFYFNTDGPQMHTGLLWQGDEVTVLAPLNHPEANAAIPESINNLGHVVGHTHLGSGRSIPTLWRRGAPLDLNALVSDDEPDKTFVMLEFAIRITDTGLIVASGTDSRDAEPRNNVYFLLSPTGVAASPAAVAPPPSTSLPPPSASSPPPSDSGRDAVNGGGEIDLVSLLFLVVVMSASAAGARRWRRAVTIARPR